MIFVCMRSLRIKWLNLENLALDSQEIREFVMENMNNLRKRSINTHKLSSISIYQESISIWTAWTSQFWLLCSTYRYIHASISICSCKPRLYRYRDHVYRYTNFCSHQCTSKNQKIELLNPIFRHFEDF